MSEIKRCALLDTDFISKLYITKASDSDRLFYRILSIADTAFLRLNVVPNIQKQIMQEIIAVYFEKILWGDLHRLHTALSNGRCTGHQMPFDEFCFCFNRGMCAGQFFKSEPEGHLSASVLS